MKPLTPDMLKYQGFFRLRAPAGRPQWEKFGYGGHAMCYSAASDSLFISGHEHYDLVAEVKVPESLTFTTLGGELMNSRAEVLREFFDPAPWRTVEERKLLDTLSGLLVRDGVLYSLWHTFYGVAPVGEIDVGTLAGFVIGTGVTSGPGLLHIGPRQHPFTQKATSGYLFEAPADWCAANGIPTQTVLCGRGDGAGNATSPRGPALFAFDPANPEQATTLLYRGDGQEPPGWTPCDKWTGGAWIRAGEYEAVVFVGEVATEPWWYGKPDEPDERPKWFKPEVVFPNDWRKAWIEQGIVDTWRPGAGSKGFHSTERAVRLEAHDPDDLASVVRGDWDSHQVTPEWSHTLTDVFHEAANPRACAWDPAGRRFFVYEAWPPVMMPGEAYPFEEPRVHVWTVELPASESEPEPDEEEPESVFVDLRVGERRLQGFLEEVEE